MPIKAQTSPHHRHSMLRPEPTINRFSNPPRGKSRSTRAAGHAPRDPSPLSNLRTPGNKAFGTQLSGQSIHRDMRRRQICGRPGACLATGVAKRLLSNFRDESVPTRARPEYPRVTINTPMIQPRRATFLDTWKWQSPEGGAHFVLGSTDIPPSELTRTLSAVMRDNSVTIPLSRRQSRSHPTNITVVAESVETPEAIAAAKKGYAALKHRVLSSARP
jgi:hypothetical protein